MISTAKLKANIKKELWSFFSTEAHTDNDIMRYINSWARAISIARNFWFNKYDHTIVVTSSTDKYDIPYQIETFFVLDEAWDPIDMLSFEDYYREKDKSNIILIEWNTLVSKKQGTFQIFYRGFPKTITSLEENVVIPEHFFDVLVLKATYFWLMDIRSYEAAADKKEIFKWMISDMAKRSSNPKPLEIKRLNKSKSKIF